MTEFNSVPMMTSGFLPWIEVGTFRIQSYFVVISLVLSAIAFWIPKRAAKLGFSPQRALDLYIAAMVFGFVGARLLHILWEEPGYYFENPLLIFDILSGGFVWYGGAMGGLLGLYFMLRRDRPPSFAGWMDVFAPIGAIGYGSGRIACLLTGCCFGAVCELPPWLHSHGEGPFRFMLPTQLFSIIWEFGAAFLLFRVEGRRPAHIRQPGQLFCMWIVLHGVGRLAMEFMRADPRGPSPYGVTVSMAMSLILILAGSTYLRSSIRKFETLGK